jgi:SAM-dependent methyltransferase
MSDNVNTQDYWDQRFSSGDWEAKRGRWQTESFARGQTAFIRLGDSYAGTILDFGCGLGDAMPIYKERYPKATLVGIDISSAAIDICKKNYGTIASFISGDFHCVPEVDVIIASNVFEHLEHDKQIAIHLLSRCRDLYVVVPYKEIELSSEHINRYDVNSFSELGKYDYHVFPCAGWSPYGLRDLWFRVYFKNIARFVLGKRIVKRSKQIIFHFSNPSRK